MRKLKLVRPWRNAARVWRDAAWIATRYSYDDALWAALEFHVRAAELENESIDLAIKRHRSDLRLARSGVHRAPWLQDSPRQ